MIIPTTYIVTTLSGLAGLFGWISGNASMHISAVPEDGNGQAFLLMVFSALISIGLVYLVHKTVEKETTFAITFHGKSE